MIIRGRFVGDAPYFAAHIRAGQFQGAVMYSHGHAIGRREAIELGLPIDRPDDVLEVPIWNLYQEYESLLKLDEPIDPEELLIIKQKDED